ncbi:hypothetical protein [Halopseudomonas pertucinogena]|uniref:Uncharacterized protein n=1 Tax=Halopseudomonas pertucinogena TaxID=86175 RepID=A0ABQ2CS59_9GAMM|nr:hypothetical protein [Halopseudomonas pertucinogena]GGJ07791.1 hypothetical protein GCM10009083_25900 [Halopseudomonas pertucinogena]
MKKPILCAALGLTLLVGSGIAAACELGRVQLNAAGERQISVHDHEGLQVGLTMQGADGRWEAISQAHGALNQRFGSAAAAARAICEQMQD